ncbi:DnaJ domain-containing protein/DUF1977 domain-containing protein [Cephalotus follicularis]|uniref:DnaJ domain-containing protein/DUF1977 domain-containing protein n=1 Tax=Cephalotus follicularis TaxID=3775 RepID=A0A1Q3BJZ4_CEPFO|nr:DnaJ domain-containing protein/DUF1977 domain-containing protein [Cephalotus follicularis]
MDSNKDDALKCFKIAKDAAESGDRIRALKFVAKARRLDPSLPVDDLLSTINSNNHQSNGIDDNDSSQSSNPHQPSDHPSVRHRKNQSNGPSSSSATSAAGFTEEQVTIVREIKRKKDYYEILGLEKSCSVEDVRKAYRKLSLKVHPDKNKAPGSEEAFKLVSKSFQCLSNEESRKRYDLVGSDEPVYEQRAAPARRGNGYYDMDVDAEEIFRNFFFGGMPPATTQFRSFNFGPAMGPRMGDQGSGLNLRMLIQLLPVLLILLLNFLPGSEPVYALSRSYPYEYKFTTQKGVNFYVKSASRFEQEYPEGSAERAGIEQRVQKDYVSALAQNCRHELQRQQWGFVRETPHCDMLRQFQSAA